jgi:pimeloyl-ACP methyl ester carboxylesterase
MNGLFQSRDGTPIYYEVQGEGPPLLLCYGLLCRRDHWKHQIPFFAKHYQLVLFDYRGHQKSGMPKNDQHLTLEWCARDIQDLLQFLDLPQVACLGHSVGVPVLSHLALMEPDRIKANVFICGSVNNPFQQMLFTDRLDAVFEASSKIYEAAPAAGDIIWKQFIGHQGFAHFVAAQLGFNPDMARPEDVAGYLEGVRQTPPAVFYRLMRDYRRVDRRPLLQQSQIPTLVIAGDEDCITPMPVQQNIADLLPRGELERIHGGSHNAHMDFPELVNERIEAFFSRVGYGCRDRS